MTPRYFLNDDPETFFDKIRICYIKRMGGTVTRDDLENYMGGPNWAEREILRMTFNGLLQPRITFVDSPASILRIKAAVTGYSLTDKAKALFWDDFYEPDSGVVH